MVAVNQLYGGIIFNNPGLFLCYLSVLNFIPTTNLTELIEGNLFKPEYCDALVFNADKGKPYFVTKIHDSGELKDKTNADLLKSVPSLRTLLGINKVSEI